MKTYDSDSFVSLSAGLHLSTSHSSEKAEKKSFSALSVEFMKNLNCYLFNADSEVLPADLEKKLSLIVHQITVH
jgi:hypothetical protein